jgi:hypothetical protein
MTFPCFPCFGPRDRRERFPVCSVTRWVARRYVQISQLASVQDSIQDLAPPDDVWAPTRKVLMYRLPSYSTVVLLLAFEKVT